eukprot:352356-Chlamydomonas_euryale.AAC.4
MQAISARKSFLACMLICIATVMRTTRHSASCVLAAWLSSRPADRLSGWPAGCLAVWPASWLSGRLAGWPA